MTLRLRNVDADLAAPVETWPYEALVSIIERGTVGDWIHLTRAIDQEPWGVVARRIEEYLSYAHPYGVAPLLQRAIARARAQAEARERVAVATEVDQLIQRSGLTMAEVASHIGTSRTRLSTYRSGKVMPSAALLVRLRQFVGGRDG